MCISIGILINIALSNNLKGKVGIESKKQKEVRR
jgi:hypothetical protein